MATYVDLLVERLCLAEVFAEDVDGEDSEAAKGTVVPEEGEDICIHPCRPLVVTKGCDDPLLGVSVGSNIEKGDEGVLATTGANG